MLHRIKKHNDINEGKWIGVGGHAEGQESPEECLLREVKEETGLDVKDAEGGYMFTYKRENPGEGDNYFVDIYRFEKDFEEKDVVLQTAETAEFALATKEEIDLISKYAFKVNEFMLDFFKKLNIDLIDFKIEFGKTSDGTIILADEISPDTCRFWDSTTHEKLDKDRFRRDMGGVEDAYAEIMKRLMGK